MFSPGKKMSNLLQEVNPNVVCLINKKVLTLLTVFHYLQNNLFHSQSQSFVDLINELIQVKFLDQWLYVINKYQQANIIQQCSYSRYIWIQKKSLLRLSNSFLLKTYTTCLSCESYLSLVCIKIKIPRMRLPGIFHIA